MKDVPVPTKPDRKEGIMKEVEWRGHWKEYNDRFSGIQTDHKIRLLLHWFKHDFFEWVDPLKCTVCKVVTNSFSSEGG